jgi:uncharacterized phage protein (TIGR02216 family)
VSGAAFPWEEAMALGLGVLRWSPQSFWRATPRELIAAYEGLSGGAGGRIVEPASRADLARLMALFPDEAAVTSGPASCP